MSIYRNRKRRSSPVVRMLFDFPQIEDRAQALFGSWLSKLDDLEDARALYMTGIYGRGFIEHKLLALTQAAEALHRRFFPGQYMNDAVFRREVYEVLKAAVPATADPSLRDALSVRLKFANEHSLRRRLRTMFESNLAILRLLVRQPLAYYSPIVDLRNEFTHLPVPSAELPSATRPDSEQVLLYNWILRLLLEACFLKAMGFSSEEIASFVERSETYRQMRVIYSSQGGQSVEGDIQVGDVVAMKMEVNSIALEHYMVGRVRYRPIGPGLSLEILDNDEDLATALSKACVKANGHRVWLVCDGQHSEHSCSK